MERKSNCRKKAVEQKFFLVPTLQLQCILNEMEQTPVFIKPFIAAINVFCLLIDQLRI